VQVMSAVGPMQAAGHNKPHGTGSIVPALAKNARTGHPLFWNGKGKHRSLGHPPRMGHPPPHVKTRRCWQHRLPPLQKNARTGHPRFRNGKGKHGSLGHPPADPQNSGLPTLVTETPVAVYRLHVIS
jgi:hypothetical protein